LNNPEIVFSIFWETERNFDGVNLEYSPDLGANWFLLGSQLSDANCEGTNWYNNSSVRFLGNMPGWSGSISAGSGGNCQTGNGSGTWLTAKHKLNAIGGLTNVIFRFNFGAGTVCNNYDGFAIDDFQIRESVADDTLIRFQCSGNRQATFFHVPGYCQTEINWNFGDPSSGASNTSTLQNPSHVFSASGDYTITKTIRYSNGLTQITDTIIRFLGVDLAIANPVLCHNGQNGSLTAQVTGTAQLINFQWSHDPNLQFPVAQNLSPGSYNLLINAQGYCYATSSIQLINPTPLQVSLEVKDETCNTRNGSVLATATGGAGQYLYLWSNAQNNNPIRSLASGTYSVQVTDANGCTLRSSEVQLRNIDYPVRLNLGRDTVVCPGAPLVLNAGNFSQYIWQDFSIASSFNVSAAGTYFVSVTNLQGCKGSDTIVVSGDCSDIYFPSAFTPNGDGLNDYFGPAGSIRQISDYSISIYNRWGQLVFFSDDPNRKWNGTFKQNRMNHETLIWYCTYRKPGFPLISRKGTLNLIR
jgi:gliding motility-associated-like protein